MMPRIMFPWSICVQAGALGVGKPPILCSLLCLRALLGPRKVALLQAGTAGSVVELNLLDPAFKHWEKIVSG